MSPTECLAHKWLAYPEPKKNIVIPTDKLKRFIIRRKWQVNTSQWTMIYRLRLGCICFCWNGIIKLDNIANKFEFLQKTGNAIRALGRITNMYSSRRSSESPASPSRKSEDSGIFENTKPKGTISNCLCNSKGFTNIKVNHTIDNNEFLQQAWA